MKLNNRVKKRTGLNDVVFNKMQQNNNCMHTIKLK